MPHERVPSAAGLKSPILAPCVLWQACAILHRPAAVIPAQTGPRPALSRSHPCQMGSWTFSSPLPAPVESANGHLSSDPCCLNAVYLFFPERLKESAERAVLRLKWHLSWGNMAKNSACCQRSASSKPWKPASFL